MSKSNEKGGGKSLTRRTILEWLKDILGKSARKHGFIDGAGNLEREQLEEIMENVNKVKGATVERLINKVMTGELGDDEDSDEEDTAGEDSGTEDSASEEESEDEENGEGAEKHKRRKKPCCSYAMKRNIVTSLEEIRRFAEEHELASAMIRALLTTLAEMALGALKGKISGTMLALVLNALNYDKAKNDAYREGEIAGRNAKILDEHFPSDDDGLPHFKPHNSPQANSSDFFRFARHAR